MGILPIDLSRGYAVLADVASRLVDVGGTERVCGALESGYLSRASTSAIRHDISGGRVGLEHAMQSLQAVWTEEFPEATGRDLGAMLRAAAGGLLVERERATQTEVVWTGPRVDQSFVRSTREVMRDIVRGAVRELIVVGYWIQGEAGDEGIVRELVQEVAARAADGISVTIALDQLKRDDGTDNRLILMGMWPTRVKAPRLLTWRIPDGEKHLKLHAKVLVADGRDALVTSANLTLHAIDRNIEMGVRVLGRPALAIANHFRLLDQSGILQPF